MARHIGNHQAAAEDPLKHRIMLEAERILEHVMMRRRWAAGDRDKLAEALERLVRAELGRVAP